MKFISQFIIIIAFTFIGELLHFFIPLPIPASIYGIVLLFICLMMKYKSSRNPRNQHFSHRHHACDVHSGSCGTH